MKISLVGVLEDGTPRRTGVLTNARALIAIQQGVDLSIYVQVIRPNGAPVLLTGSDTLTLTVKKRPQQYPASIAKTATILGGVGTFTIGPNDMRQMLPGLFGYDVWLTRAGSHDPVIPLSPLQLLASATKW